MDRRILVQVTAPAVVIGLLLFAACFVGAWYINRLQRNTDQIFTANVASLRAAQELEIRVRQLRFHTLLELIDPSATRRQAIEDDHRHFEEAFRVARQSANTPQERACVQAIDAGYRRYLEELAAIGNEASREQARTDFQKLEASHPIYRVVDPCQELLRLNQEEMDETAAESTRVGNRARGAMLLLGVIGPLSGLIIGYGMARGLSRSIYRLSVRVQDMAQRLDQNVASVSIAADGDIQHLDQQLQHVVRHVEDVAGRLQRQQREMLRAEQLSAVGQLAASVAHEVRNPLTAVKMLVESATRGRNRKPLTDDDLKVIHREIVRLEQTVQSFLDFARLPSPRRSTCDLRTVIAQAVELVQARARQQDVNIVVSCPDRPLPGNVDRNQLCTVLVNLFLNSLDAMPSGGRLEVSLAATADATLRLTVSDSGGGIPPEILDRLFTPFASSKPTGTGLGLSLSRRIVEEHGGTLTGSNRPEGGACFTILLSGVGQEEGAPGAEGGVSPQREAV